MLAAGTGTTVSGAGTAQAPYKVNVAPSAACQFAQVSDTPPAGAAEGCIWMQPTGGAAGTGGVRIYRRASGQWREGLLTDTTNRSAFFKTASAANHAVTVYQASSSGVDTAAALNVVSDNPQSSAMYLSGTETNRGTLKITHRGHAAGADADAAALSIHLDDTAGGSAAQGIFIDGCSTGRRLRIRDCAGNDRVEVNAAGNLITRAVPFLVTGVQVGGTSVQLAGGAGGVIGITNRTTVPNPATPPVGGGVFYAENGAAKWLGSAGTVTTLAPA